MDFKQHSCNGSQKAATAEEQSYLFNRKGKKIWK